MSHKSKLTFIVLTFNLFGYPYYSLDFRESKFLYITLVVLSLSLFHEKKHLSDLKKLWSRDSRDLKYLCERFVK
jgi:hypothetical protein